MKRQNTQWRTRHSILLGCLCAVLVTGCQTKSTVPATAAIHLNQLGFTPASPKQAAIVAAGRDQFTLVDANGRIVFRGELGPAATWPPAEQTVRLANFDHLREPGTYQLRVGETSSIRFEIKPDPYAELNRAALRVFYLSRASTAIPAEFGGPYARPAGHDDQSVRIHESATGPGRDVGTTIASPGGWYDAGDYNKYIVNSSITTYTLLAALEHFPEYYRNRSSNIPESTNALPDILDEALWNLSWMLSMQDPTDGGVYHKLTSKKFSGMVTPEQATAPRYVVAKSTTAALDLAAVAATAARVLKQYPRASTELIERCEQAALAAWNWAKANPKQFYQQPDDIQTGTYSPPHEDARDEFAWAAAELFLLTDNADFLAEFRQHRRAAGVPSWDWVEPLAWISLAQHKQRVPELQQAIEQSITEVADQLVAEHESSAYGVPVYAFPKNAMIGQQEKAFVWGSNGHVANQTLMLLQAYRLQGEEHYLNAARANLDYLLGRNPIGISYVTGFGQRSPQFIHDRISVSDGVDAPLPGMLAGGPNQDQQDRSYCENQGVGYPSSLPALSYVDEICSYASNEMAINWNAPLVYISGAIDAFD